MTFILGWEALPDTTEDDEIPAGSVRVHFDDRMTGAEKGTMLHAAMEAAYSAPTQTIPVEPKRYEDMSAKAIRERAYAKLDRMAVDSDFGTVLRSIIDVMSAEIAKVHDAAHTYLRQTGYGPAGPTAGLESWNRANAEAKAASVGSAVREVLANAVQLRLLTGAPTPPVVASAVVSAVQGVLAKTDKVCTCGGHASKSPCYSWCDSIA